MIDGPKMTRMRTNVVKMSADSLSSKRKPRTLILGAAVVVVGAGVVTTGW